MCTRDKHSYVHFDCYMSFFRENLVSEWALTNEGLNVIPSEYPGSSSGAFGNKMVKREARDRKHGPFFDHNSCLYNYRPIS